MYETPLNHGIYVLIYQLVTWIFVHQQYEIQKKQPNQIQPNQRDLMQLAKGSGSSSGSTYVSGVAFDGTSTSIGAHGMVGPFC